MGKVISGNAVFQHVRFCLTYRYRAVRTFFMILCELLHTCCTHKRARHSTHRPHTRPQPLVSRVQFTNSPALRKTRACGRCQPENPARASSKWLSGTLAPDHTWRKVRALRAPAATSRQAPVAASKARRALARAVSGQAGSCRGRQGTGTQGTSSYW